MKSGWAWVVLTFAEARDVAEVEVVGVNLPEGMRVLLSEDADDWFEDEGGLAQYVWVVFPEGSEGVEVRANQVESQRAVWRKDIQSVPPVETSRSPASVQKSSLISVLHNTGAPCGRRDE
ncbi:MAG: hypothetical protein IKQ15_02530 [Kiritimatiellae bacterium]|nr:hypothetical protein [Kiritimatiellia bacterium]